MIRVLLTEDIQTRREMLLFFETHSTEETEKRFNVTGQTIRKWKKRYDGSNESLIDGRRNRIHITKSSYTDEENALVTESLSRYNGIHRKRNVLQLTYHEVYETRGRFHGRCSRSSLRKRANRLIGACQRKTSVATEKPGRKKYHQPKSAGELQIDKKYVPAQCFSEALQRPEYIEKLRVQLKQHAIHECNSTLRSLYEDLERHPTLEKMIRYCCREAIDQYILYCIDIDKSDTREFLKKKFYQYTAVDECSRWTFRMMFDTQSEQAAFRFLNELIKAAPFHIKRIKTDNGSEFTSKYLKNHGAHETLFEARLLMEGIKYYRIQPGKPWQNGKVESQHRLDQEQFYNNLQMNDLEDGQYQFALYDMQCRLLSKSCMKWKNPIEVLAEMGIAA